MSRFLEKITCPYHFEFDTIDGLVSELFSAVDLNKKDYNIIKHNSYTFRFPRFIQITKGNIRLSNYWGFC